MRTVAYWLSLILIFVIPWENAILFEGVGTVSRVVGLVVAGFWVATVVVTGHYRKLRPFHLVVGLFVLWNIVTVFWSVDADETILRFQTYFQLVGLVLILWDLYRTRAAVNAGLQAYVLGAYVSVGSTVYDYLTGSGFSPTRYAAEGFNPNNIGLILALGIPVAWHLALAEADSKKDYVLKVLNYTYLPAATFAILLTASRGTLIATVPAFLFVLGSLTRLKPFARVSIFMATIWALFAVQTMVPQSSFERLATIGTSIAERDLGGRVPVWREGIAIFSAHPFLGIGSGTFQGAAVKTRHGAHNVFISVLVETGMIGFILFAIILAMTVYHAVRHTKWAARLWLTVLMIWGIGASSGHLEHKKHTWLFLSLVIVSAGVSVQRNESRLRSKFPVQYFSSSQL